MTYCVALRLNRGLAYLSDTRTNAGVDDISTFRKMSCWESPGERTITIMSAGNLATTQAVVTLLDERANAPDEQQQTIMTAPTMFHVAKIVGQTLREAINASTATSGLAPHTFGASLIVGGQVRGGEARLFLIYPEGNFIETADDTPFLQIGETKYGRPMLVRAFDADMSFEEACKLLLVSLDSTVKANLSVGLPVDMQVYPKDSFRIGRQFRVTADNSYYQAISAGWGKALREAFQEIPVFDLDAPA
ncbi:MAG: peptidase [Alphaproteobacteria bacterium]